MWVHKPGASGRGNHLARVVFHKTCHGVLQGLLCGRAPGSSVIERTMDVQNGLLPEGRGGPPSGGWTRLQLRGAVWQVAVHLGGIGGPLRAEQGLDPAFLRAGEPGVDDGQDR